MVNDFKRYTSLVWVYIISTMLFQFHSLSLCRRVSSSILLRLAIVDLVHLLEDVEDGTGTPGLGRARVVAERAV